jgi:two-component system, chemotaxis family, chemotaxis protein CheY
VNLTRLGQISGLEANSKMCRAKQSPLSIMNKPILIIDDNRPLRQTLRLLLESHAFDCKEADDGQEGLTLLDGGLSVDVILSDYHMPVINGVDFLKALTYRVSGKGVPVILLSGNMTKEIEQIAKQAGAFAVMAKPYDPQELLETISRACNRPIF